MPGCADRTTRSSVVTPTARELRRSLSPTALVLEDLLLDVDTDIAIVSVRELGRTLGLAKDTAFGTGSYRISTPARLTIVDATPHTRVTIAPVAQLSLAIEGTVSRTVFLA